MSEHVKITRLSYSPQWIRTIVLGAIEGSYDRQNDANVWSLGSQDVDVSDDGETWFHLVGPRCRNNLTLWPGENLLAHDQHQQAFCPCQIELFPSSILKKFL
jgi:hypothetical protein